MIIEILSGTIITGSFIGINILYSKAMATAQVFATQTFERGKVLLDTLEFAKEHENYELLEQIHGVIAKHSVEYEQFMNMWWWQQLREVKRFRERQYEVTALLEKELREKEP